MHTNWQTARSEVLTAVLTKLQVLMGYDAGFIGK